jgi:hypothetical protein
MIGAGGRMEEPGQEPAAMALPSMGKGRQGRKGQQHTEGKRSGGPFDGDGLHGGKGRVQRSLDCWKIKMSERWISATVNVVVLA